MVSKGKTVTEVMSPEELKIPKLTGRSFEKLLKGRHQDYERRGTAVVDAYSVQSSFQSDGASISVPSPPDFEGLSELYPSQIIFDAKVCGKPHFGLDRFRDKTEETKRGSKRRQLTFMYRRARFGAFCFFLIHWSCRELKRSYHPQRTYLFPVHRELPFWTQFEAGEIKTLSREVCAELGVEVLWSKYPRARTFRPAWLEAAASSFGWELGEHGADVVRYAEVYESRRQQEKDTDVF